MKDQGYCAGAYSNLKTGIRQEQKVFSIEELTHAYRVPGRGEVAAVPMSICILILTVNGCVPNSLVEVLLPSQTC